MKYVDAILAFLSDHPGVRWFLIGAAFATVLALAL